MNGTPSDLGFLLKKGTASEMDAVCYSQKDQAILNGIIAQGNQCLSRLQGELPKEKMWYENEWLWFSIGLIGGGSTVYFLTK